MKKYKILIWGAGNRAKTILTMLKVLKDNSNIKIKKLKTTKLFV